MYPTISFDDINPSSPDAFNQLNQYYQVQIDSLSFVLDQACELIESELRPTDESNTAIALGMMNTMGRRMESLIEGT